MRDFLFRRMRRGTAAERSHVHAFSNIEFDLLACDANGLGGLFSCGIAIRSRSNVRPHPRRAHTARWARVPCRLGVACDQLAPVTLLGVLTAVGRGQRIRDVELYGALDVEHDAAEIGA